MRNREALGLLVTGDNMSHRSWLSSCLHGPTHPTWVSHQQRLIHTVMNWKDWGELFWATAIVNLDWQIARHLEFQWDKPLGMPVRHFLHRVDWSGKVHPKCWWHRFRGQQLRANIPLPLLLDLGCKWPATSCSYPCAFIPDWSLGTITFSLGVSGLSLSHDSSVKSTTAASAPGP